MAGLRAYFRRVAPWRVGVWVIGYVLLIVGWHPRTPVAYVGGALILVGVVPLPSRERRYRRACMTAVASAANAIECLRSRPAASPSDPEQPRLRADDEQRAKWEDILRSLIVTLERMRAPRELQESHDAIRLAFSRELAALEKYNAARREDSADADSLTAAYRQAAIESYRRMGAAGFKVPDVPKRAR